MPALCTPSTTTSLIVPGPSALESIAGVPLAARAAVLLDRAGAGEILFHGDERVATAVSHGHAACPRISATSSWPDAGRVVVVAGDVAFDRALLPALGRIAGSAIAIAPGRSGFVLSGDVRVARSLVEAFRRGELAKALAESAVSELPAGDLLLDGSTESARREATQAVLSRTRKAADGPHRRLFERRLSQAISRRLLPWPVSPSLVTAISLALGIVAAALLAQPSHAVRCAGALVLVLATILDGCDGEIARAKLLESRRGSLFDTTADIVTAVAVLGGICAGVLAELGSSPLVNGAVSLLISGTALAVTVVIATGGAAASQTKRALDDLDNRGWTYFVLLFAALDALPAFVFCAGLGAHLFAVLYLVQKLRTPWPAS